MARGLRKPPQMILSEAQIAELKQDIAAIGADLRVFVFNYARVFGTSYVPEYDIIAVKGNIFPDTESGSTHPRDLMSARAVLAHEYYGHRTYQNTPVPIDDWRDEFRASYTAAKITPNLTEEDRRYLILDALARAAEEGVSIRHNNFIRSVLYGYTNI
ncbi:MAG: hypothetical protein LBM98_06735 [Oscillospiraceae bacterium]|nr:hypothetical protein [Oscillospiraceae bacterium]